MATKAQRFKAEMLVEQSSRKAKARPKRSVSARPSKPHNVGARAGRGARVSYEASEGRPSRKSTRRSAHHQRAANRIERTNQLRQAEPGTRAFIARAGASKIRGKS